MTENKELQERTVVQEIVTTLDTLNKQLRMLPEDTTITVSFIRSDDLIDTDDNQIGKLLQLDCNIYVKNATIALYRQTIIKIG